MEIKLPFVSKGIYQRKKNPIISILGGKYSEKKPVQSNVFNPFGGLVEQPYESFMCFTILRFAHLFPYYFYFLFLFLCFENQQNRMSPKWIPRTQ